MAPGTTAPGWPVADGAAVADLGNGAEAVEEVRESGKTGTELPDYPVRRGRAGARGGGDGGGERWDREEGGNRQGEGAVDRRRGVDDPEERRRGRTRGWGGAGVPLPVRHPRRRGVEEPRHSREGVGRVLGREGRSCGVEGQEPVAKRRWRSLELSWPLSWVLASGRATAC